MTKKLCDPLTQR